MGRFISRDPIDIGDDVNLYRYCWNNGVRFVDLMGTEWKPVVKDKWNDKRIDTLHPLIRTKTIDFIDQVYLDLWITLRVTTGYRSIKEQNKLYMSSRNWNNWPWRTNAKWGESYHNYWLAIDIVEITEKINKKTWKLEPFANYGYDHKKVSDIWKQYWFEWWWDWIKKKDQPHYQYTFGFSTKELKTKIKNWEVDDDWFIGFKW